MSARVLSLSSKTWRRLFVILFMITIGSVMTGCNKSAPPAATQEQAKRYHLVGRVVSIDVDHATLNVDGQDIPGFMSAMVMPYPVRDTKSISSLNPGDEITADVVVTSDGDYLENIVVTKKAAAPGNAKPSGAKHEPQPGDKVPDFALVDQSGKRIQLASFRGDVLLMTFIYTRCPFPDFCPLVSGNFAQIYSRIHNNPSLEHQKIHLLSVSFDSKYDTPAVLKKYAASFDETTGGNPFDRWEFATVPATELPDVANFFGLVYDFSGGQIVHSLSTTVVNPDGTVYKWYEDSDWKPADLINDAEQSLQQASQHNPRSSSSVPNA
jgi:protein SCO1